MMPVTDSVQRPLFVSVSGLSRMSPTQTWPKLPVSARMRLRCGVGAMPNTENVFVPDGSSVTMVMVPDLEPKREQQTCGRGAFVPLAFQPGDAFQFDWSEDWAILGGER